jgi:hypothetical protein
MDCLFVLAIITRSCNKLEGGFLDLQHCICIETKQLRVQLPASCLLIDPKGISFRN